VRNVIEMRVWKIAHDERTDTPVVILQELSGKRVLPIWIGHAEARAIAVELAGQKFQRPLTHDLMMSIIQGLEASICKVTILELKNNTFYAKLFVEKRDGILGIDARPSDSIALALRTKSPIFVADDLLKNTPTSEDMTEDERAEELRRYIDDVSPEDFGKFPL
jgi:bifunctional DNase/RNase